MQPITPHPEDSIWLKVQGRAVGLDHDIALGVVYVPPNAPKERDPFGPLRQGLEHVSAGMPCYVLGDLNARIGAYCLPPDIAPFQYVDCIMEEDMEVDHAPRRQLQDQGLNPYGRELFRLVDMSNMVILNSTALDATHGAYTCYTQPLSPSTIDLALSSKSLHHTFHEMRDAVIPPGHNCAISLTTNLPITALPPRDLVSKDVQRVSFNRPRWNDDTKGRVTLDLSTPDIKTACHNIFQQINPVDGKGSRSFDQVVTDLNRIITKATDTQCKVIKQQIPPSKNRQDCQASSIDQPWFDETCDRAKRDMRNMAVACHRQKIPLPARYLGSAHTTSE